MAKKEYYSSEQIFEKNAQYNLIIGERSNGKSYDIKINRGLKKAIEKQKCTFALLKRYAEDIKGSFVDDYFADAPIKKLTKNKYNYVTGYRGSIYLANLNEDGKIEKGLCIGKVFCLSNDERYKSRSYPDIEDIIFEEFTTANFYLKNETKRLMQLVSTIFRRREGRVWMIANSISRVSPYFTEWALSGVYNMQQGQIDLYSFKDENGNVSKIAVEYCASSGEKKSGMFFGNYSKNIDSGFWEVDDYPHLPCEYNDTDFSTLYQIGYVYNDFAFIISLCIFKGNKFLYIKPAKKLNDWWRLPSRVLSNKFSIDKKITKSLNREKRIERIISDLYRNNKICYSHNLCGADFNTCRKNDDIVF